MEKDDAYNKIATLEGEVMQLKALRTLSMNRSPEGRNKGFKKTEEVEVVNSFDLS